MIKRFNPPTHLDPMPYLSEWHHELEDGSVQIWVQCNEVVDENTKPNWRRLGDIFEIATEKTADIPHNKLCCWPYASQILEIINGKK